MIDRPALLRDLQKEVTALEAAITTRIGDDPKMAAHLRTEHEAARAALRTAESFEMWSGEQVTQSAVAWVLACVFIRFLEDNHLLPAPHLSGPGTRRQLALDQKQLYFQRHPTETDREYLRHVFREVAVLPAAGDLFGEKHNPLWALAPTGDGATRLLTFFQRILPETGEIAHDFTDPSWNSRFLGDLYQDLSEAARKKFALLQTPEFVEEFILDRTLTPAIETFGYQEVRLIDPTCGSGHFLLGAFHRLFALHQKQAPGTNARDLAQRALAQVAGVDLNPFAVAIARFRLLLAALKLSGITRLADAPGFHMHLAVGDSLLHGKRFGLATKGLQPALLGSDPLRHVYEAEDAEALRSVLGQQYHAVVGNPPYITVKDKAVNEAYRKGYGSCHRQYSLGVPFTERFFELAITGGNSAPTGFVGMITANSFMKREFGQKLIENVLPKLDLTHVVDTSGAYIPGHGTPTVILFGRNRPPASDTVRTVMGIRGEPRTPEDPAQGLVWRAIVAQIDQVGSQSDFISVADYERTRFTTHPWSLGGGGAAELKDRLDATTTARLSDVVEEIGFVCMTRADDVYFTPRHALRDRAVAEPNIIENVEGEVLRDWTITSPNTALFPYNPDLTPVAEDPSSPVIRFLWPYRTILWLRREPNGNHKELGLTWYEWSRFQRERFRSPLSIAFAFVATHNHFVLDRGGKVFKQSAPVIKLPAGATEDDHLALLGVLNSSTACFWIRQVTQPKTQTTGMDQEAWRVRREFDGTKLKELPIPLTRPLDLASALDQLAQDHQRETAGLSVIDAARNPVRLSAAKEAAHGQAAQMVALQEELDWRCYRLFGVTKEDLCADAERSPPLAPAERAFAIVLARRVASGETSTTWFEEHGYVPVTELPRGWPSDYRRLVERRIDLIKADHNIGLIEQPEYKRRWNIEAFDDLLQVRLRSWLVERLETPGYWPRHELQSVARVADRAGLDADFMHVAALLRGHSDFDLTALVIELVVAESVPALPACRYIASGRFHRVQWERTWILQRAEDAIDARTKLPTTDPAYLTDQAAAALKKSQIGDIPVPPKYNPTDFQRSSYWGLRGKLDVPKERFISFPHCEREGDRSLVIGWAGWNHLQQAEAIAAYYVSMKDTEGWSPERLTPLLAALRELLPWLEQWHNDIHPDFGLGMGDYYRGFVENEMRSLNLTPATLTDWKPPSVIKKKTKAKPTAGHETP